MVVDSPVAPKPPLVRKSVSEASEDDGEDEHSFISSKAGSITGPPAQHSSNKQPSLDARRSSVASASSSTERITVVVRVRPLVKRELEQNSGICVAIHGDDSLTAKRPKAPGNRPISSADNRTDSVRFTFDKVFGEGQDNAVVYDCIGRDIVDQAFQGYNCSVFAYGQTGSGKSFTMAGNNSDPGLIPLICREIFERAAQQPVEVEASYLEIYNEKLTDLLRPDRKEPLRMRESKTAGVYVEGLAREAVGSFEDLSALIADGDRSRVVAATKMNAHSSRSHAIVTLRLVILPVAGDSKNVKRTAVIHLVDLAGSERQSSTEATGIRLKEASAINKSLMQLGKVINALATRKPGDDTSHIPYRDSVLTRLLQQSLGGNAKTLMLTNISPADVNYEETLSSLRYADRAKAIVNKALVNEDADKKLVRELKEEIARLKEELQLAAAGAGTSNSAQLRAELSAAQADVEGLEMSWGDKVAAAGNEQALRHAFWSDQGLAGAGSAAAKLPRLVNLNEDPMLSELLVYPLRPGTTVLGRRVGLNFSRQLTGNEINPDIPLQGPSIMNHHCDIVHDEEAGTVTLIPAQGAHTFVNGAVVEEPLELHSGNRIVFGNHHIFRFLDPRAPPRAAAEDVVDWEFAARELASALGDMQQLKDETDRKLERKEREADEVAAALTRDKLEAEKALQVRIEELKHKEAELQAERGRREAEAKDRARVEKDHSKLAAALEAIKHEYDAKSRDTAAVRAEIEESFAARVQELEQQAAKHRDLAMQVAGLVQARDTMLVSLETSMMRALQGIREANCVIDELKLNLRFDLLTQSLFDPDLDTKHTFVTVLLSRTGGGKGSLLLEEEELMDRFTKIRDIYDEYLETGVARIPEGSDPFEIIDDRELIGWAVVPFHKDCATSANPPHRAYPIVDPISREVHGELVVAASSEPPLTECKGRAATLTFTIFEAKDLKPVGAPRCIYRVVGAELHEGPEFKGIADTNPHFEHTVTVDIRRVSTNLSRYLEFSGVLVEIWGTPIIPRFAQRPSTAWATESFRLPPKQQSPSPQVGSKKSNAFDGEGSFSSAGRDNSLRDTLFNRAGDSLDRSAAAQGTKAQSRGEGDPESQSKLIELRVELRERMEEIQQLKKALSAKEAQLEKVLRERDAAVSANSSLSSSEDMRELKASQKCTIS